MFSAKTLRYVQCISMVILLLTGYSNQCGPGPKSPGSSKIRRKQNLSPLVYKQHVPNISENTFGASGLPDGSIKRNDPRFKDLVENHNTNIIFRDEERDGSDRIMTKRCKEKLDILATMVLNEWPGNPPEVPPVKVKVKEAWDDTYLHGDNSLHYEGRAVDVATNDRDRSKLGTLARLAQDAGFDWVFYESHGHIHCSVKSESSVAIKTGGCFTGDGQVQVENRGTMSMLDLRVGDRVLTMDSSGTFVYSDVITFMDRDDEGFGLFYTFITDAGKQLTLTQKHLVYVIKQNSSDFTYEAAETMYAEDAQRGQYLLLKDGQTITASKIKDITIKTQKGIYAPLTKHGTIIVNGIFASCYAYINNINVAHYAFAPFRAFYDISQFLQIQPTSVNNEYRNSTNLPRGVHWYAHALYSVGTTILSQNTLSVH